MSFSEWKKVKIKDVTTKIGSGSTPRGGSSVYQESGTAFIRSQNIYNNYFDFSGLVYIDDNAANKLKGVTLYPNDVLLNITGDSVARCTIVPEQLLPARVNQHVCIIRADEKELDYRFLKYTLVNPTMQELMLSYAQTGGTRAALTKLMVEEFEINLPSLEEQKAIANVLSSLDEKIELNNQMNNTLEEMAKVLFKRWFVDFEFPNENGEPYKSSGGEMVDSELGMIPKGWQISILSDLCSLETKSEKPFENKEVVYEHFSLPACDEGKLPVIELGSQISSNKYKIDNECILISKLNPTTKRIWNPTCTTKNAICSTEFMVYRPKKVQNKDFCYEVINSDRFTEFLLANVTGSTGSRQRTQPKKTLEYKIALGDMLIIEKFSNMIKPIHELVKNNIESNKILRTNRDTLLPKLMSGEIRVTDIQN